MNKVALVGRLTKDPEVRYTANNQTPVAKFTIAVRRRFTKQEGQPDADFLPIVVWGKPAESCGKYISKGSLVSVAGRIETRSWDDQDGKRHFMTEIIADEVNFLDSKNDANRGSGNDFAKDSGDFYPAEGEDDLPF